MMLRLLYECSGGDNQRWWGELKPYLLLKNELLTLAVGGDIKTVGIEPLCPGRHPSLPTSHLVEFPLPNISLIWGVHQIWGKILAVVICCDVISHPLGRKF